jgi:general secretion pathway protein H
MPISATGNSQAGFTLVELLVALVIIGAMTAMVVLAFPDPRGSVSADAEGLAARLVAARDLAIVGGRDIGVRFDGRGYGFAQRRRDGWQALPEKALQPRNWSSGVTAQARVEGNDALVFDATGLATPAVITLSRDGAETDVSITMAGAVVIDAH